ncbi:MAG: hypothetical protein Q7K03_08715 [Dehalococcoidia bacterium]|nr:hypothetical protein [Dehalococcoidia bacterium]
MTQGSGPRSMRYSIDEVLSGMLASITRNEFTDDVARLGAVFKTLSAKHSLLAPFAAVGGEADFSVVLKDALQKLVNKEFIHHEPGRYALTPKGRASCVSSKRMLFKATDVGQLEATACDFEEQLAV